jgi:hypothetical protein
MDWGNDDSKPKWLEECLEEAEVGFFFAGT